MVETSPFKTPPVAPADVALEGRTHPTAVQGRNTGPGHIGIRINEGRND